MKYPYLKLYTGDWLKDPRLSLCQSATRGVWIDLICRMHELDQSGELSGTIEELSRLTRCSTVELTHALTDLQNKLAADVTRRNGTVTVICRRMKREHIKRENDATRQRRHRSVTSNREQIPDNDSDSDSEIGLGRVREFARGKGIGSSDAEWFYWKGRGNGWTNGGKPILDWKATLLSWFRAGYLPSQKATNGKPKQVDPNQQRRNSEYDRFMAERAQKKT